MGPRVFPLPGLVEEDYEGRRRLGSGVSRGWVRRSPCMEPCDTPKLCTKYYKTDYLTLSFVGFGPRGPREGGELSSRLSVGQTVTTQERPKDLEGERLRFSEVPSTKSCY